MMAGTCVTSGSASSSGAAAAPYGNTHGITPYKGAAGQVEVDKNMALMIFIGAMLVF